VEFQDEIREEKAIVISIHSPQDLIISALDRNMEMRQILLDRERRSIRPGEKSLGSIELSRIREGVSFLSTSPRSFSSENEGVRSRP
jgi:hypothetical protein